ncbi:MAG: hypothetical protein IJM74_04125, partial [Bacteroidales bacterium]|nr:hypothetical protein [Bacteroidales bacterium]
TVVYTLENVNSYHFHIVNNTTGTVASIGLNAKDGYVKDFVILDDSVFFIANCYANFPVIGYFSLNDVLVGHGSVKYVRYTRATETYPRRMELLRVSDGLHVMMVGSHYGTDGTEYGFVADAYRRNNMPGIWRIEYYLSGGIELFDDITVTDSYVVTSGQKPGAGNLLMRKFERPTNTDAFLLNNTLFNSATPHIYDTVYLYNGPTDVMNMINIKTPVFVTHSEKDYVGIACLADSGRTGKYGVTMKLVNANTFTGVTDIFLHQDNHYNRQSRLKDLQYEASIKTFLMLEDTFAIPAWPTSCILAFSPADMTHIRIHGGVLPDGYFYHSMDNYYKMSNNYVTCGKSTLASNYSLFYSPLNSNSCFFPILCPVQKVPFVFTPLFYPINPIMDNRPIMYQYFNAQSHEIEVICQ